MQQTEGVFIRGIEEFDPLFFEMSPKEAIGVDPRQRLLLQEGWRTFEDAGCAGSQIRGQSCGVFIGVEEGDYGYLIKDQGLGIGNHNGILAARISYLLDLRGPNLAINTACSSGLVAVHQACQSLQRNECELALAGGVNLIISPMVYLALSKMGMLSREGQCCVFDQRATGMVPGEAVAAVLLKRVSQAIADQDMIYGVIAGSGVNYDGKTNGITAPSALSQAELIEDIFKRYRIDPEQIHYVMAHSVGSHLGDPIEFQALTNVFRKFTDKKQYCAIGSVKSLIGHSFAASGVVSLIGMLLAMNKNVIPGSLDIDQENEFIDFENSPFYINETNEPWKLQDSDKRHRGLVGATGMSGTNAYAVIEAYNSIEYTCKEASIECIQGNNSVILPVSAKNEDCLKAYTKKISAYLKETVSEIDDKVENHVFLANLAYTFQIGREAMEDRVAFIVSDIPALIKMLKNFTEGREYIDDVYRGNIRKQKRKLVEFEQDNNGILQKHVKNRNLAELAKQWIHGAQIDWSMGYKEWEKPKRIHVPTYPFQRKKYWIDRSFSLEKTFTNEKTPDNISYRREKIPSIEQHASDHGNHDSQQTELQSLKQQLKTIFANVFYIDEEIDETKLFSEIGMTSINVTDFIEQVEEQLKVTLKGSDIFEYPSIRELANYLSPQYAKTNKIGSESSLASTQEDERRMLSPGVDTNQEVLLQNKIDLEAVLLDLASDNIDIEKALEVIK